MGSIPHDSPNASSLGDAAFTLPSWEQVGGTHTMRRVVDLIVERAVVDPVINLDRDGTYAQSPDTIARTKSLALGFLSCALGGPLPYSGRPLALVH